MAEGGELIYVAYFFPPAGGGGVQRTVKFVKYLAPLGWQSQVVTVTPGAFWVEDPTLAADLPATTQVTRTRAMTGPRLLGWLGDGRGAAGAPRNSRIWSALRGTAAWFTVPDAYWGWVPFAYRAARRLRRPGIKQVLVTTSSPDSAHLVGLLWRRHQRPPWVADFRDPWVRRLTFKAPTRWHLKWHTILEGRVLDAADRVLVTNEETKDDFLARHPRVPGDKFRVIPNGFDPDDLPVIGQPRAAPAAAGRVLLHAGLLSGRRNLAPILAALCGLAVLKPELAKRLRLVQLGPREAVNDALVEKHNLGGAVQFRDPVDHHAVLQAMAAADWLLLIESASARGALITPGKLFEYLAVGRPILALVPEGPAARIVRECDAGVVIDPDNTAAISETLAAWLSGGAPARGARPEATARFHRQTLASQFAGVLEGVA